MPLSLRVLSALLIIEVIALWVVAYKGITEYRK
jgi:hypothetical protein